MENTEIKPKLAVTGYRGIWGKTLNEQIAFEYARSYARMIVSEPGSKKRVLVGRDTRPSGASIFGSVKEALEKENIEVVNAGIIPTPSILLLVKKLNLDGGVMITASHNPTEYNGIKFVVRGGRLNNEIEVEKIEMFRKDLTMEERIPTPGEIENGTIDNKVFRKIHIDAVMSNIDADLIRSKNFKVTLDSINGTGALIGTELLRELGCEVNLINGEQNGNFAHPPEPLPENLTQVAKATLESNSDIGFAQDPDADRLAVINERGEIISEEYTMTLAMKNILKKTPGPVVMTASSSKVNEDVAREYGQKVFKTKQGEANVLGKILEINAPIGGEGGGGMIYPKINTSRDSLAGMGLILELIAQENKKISEIVATFPKYYMKKDKIPVTDKVDLVYDKLKKSFNDAELSEIDGPRFDWPDSSWLGVRASNTEPIIRITIEAKTPERINTLFEQVRLTLNAK
jgi:phosphomannomutase